MPYHPLFHKGNAQSISRKKTPLKTELNKWKTTGRSVQSHRTQTGAQVQHFEQRRMGLHLPQGANLNQSLKRCPHKIPTLEELNAKIADSRVFSKPDAKAGYWSVHLDPDSLLLTTFRTPFGRYCWTRLPFVLNVSQDNFQARMDEVLEDLPGVTNIHDDVRFQPQRSHGLSRSMWIDLQLRKMRHPQTTNFLLWIYLLSGGDRTRSREGQNHRKNACTTDKRRAPKVPRHYDIHSIIPPKLQ